MSRLNALLERLYRKQQEIEEGATGISDTNQRAWLLSKLQPDDSYKGFIYSADVAEVTWRVWGIAPSGRVFIGSSHYIRYTDDWGTTESATITSDDPLDGNYITTFRNLVVLDDNSLVVRAANEGSVFKSNDVYTVFTKVMDGVMDGSGLVDAGFTRYKNIILACNYGSGLTNLEIWISKDEGTTWSMIMQENPDVGWNHMHDVVYDPYENLVWGCSGDDYNGKDSNVNRVWVSGDYGQNWTWFGGLRATQIMPLPNCVLFGSDESGRMSVFRYDRPMRGTSLIRESLPANHAYKKAWWDITPPSEYPIKETHVFGVFPGEVDGSAGTWATNSCIIHGAEPKVLFGWRNVQGGYPPTVWGTKDGIRFYPVWKSDDNEGSIQGVFGPDDNGIIAVGYRKGEQEYLVKLTPQA